MLGGLYELTEAEIEEVESGFQNEYPAYTYNVGLTEISDKNWRDHPWRRCEFDRHTSWKAFKYYLAMPSPMRSVKRAYAHYLIAEKGENPGTAFYKTPSSTVYNDAKAVSDEGDDLRDYNYMSWVERAKAWDKFKNTLETENTVSKRRHVTIQEFEQTETLRQYWYEIMLQSMKNFDTAVKIAKQEGKQLSQNVINQNVLTAKRLAETHAIFTKDQRGSVQMPSTYTHTQNNESPDEIFKWQEPDSNSSAELEEMLDRLKSAVKSGNVEDYKNGKAETDEETTEQARKDRLQ